MRTSLRCDDSALLSSHVREGRRGAVIVASSFSHVRTRRGRDAVVLVVVASSSSRMEGVGEDEA